MVAGINGASNSPANKKKTKDYDPSTGEMKTAWSPFSGGTKYKSYDNPGDGSVPPRYPDESIKSYKKRRYESELYK